MKGKIVPTGAVKWNKCFNRVISFQNWQNPAIGTNYAYPMAWGTYMLRKSFVLVFIRLLVKARQNPFRFEMLHRTPGNPND
jgi:hypothetical protein